ncbi:uncharacterized protein N7506_011686 [Penicillium brevicompactum]|uniref:uncharacterized protein n=1 Tax=Penicillium brevicompactum TaxID=5074 RepID=UPI0025407607|nr:uncharacterized protein N7506_011686 [Penicillium brevicompactum]KAJ5318982.1 hypothetical protein N7506_011686 [Penicillium brevicompactum]
MAEASLVFPICCLTFSFIFVILFYSASIRERAGALCRNIILPICAWVERKLSTQTNQAIAISEPAYEVISDEKDEEIEEEPQQSPERPWFFPRSQSRYREASTTEIASPSPSPKARNPSQTQRPSGIVLLADGMLPPPTASESDEDEPEGDRSPSLTLYTPDDSDDDWDNDSYGSNNDNRPLSGSMGYRQSSGIDDLPDVWQAELQQPIFAINSAGTSAWVDRIVRWTALTTFASVAPPDVLEAMDERMAAAVTSLAAGMGAL